MKKTIKKITAGILAFALISGVVPANVGGGGLFGGTAIVASAAQYDSGEVNISDLKKDDILKVGVVVNCSIRGTYWNNSFIGGTFNVPSTNESTEYWKIDSAVDTFSWYEIFASPYYFYGSQDWTLTPVNATYNGEPVTGYIFNGTGYGTMTVRYSGRNGTEYNSTSAPTDVGDYTVTVKYSGGKIGSCEYNSRTKTADFTIAPSYNHVLEVPATCTTAGNIEYYKGSDNKIYTKSGDTYTETTLEAVTIPATGHAWEFDSRTREGENLIATFKCKNDASHKQTVTLTPSQVEAISKTPGVSKEWEWTEDYSEATLTIESIPENLAAVLAYQLGIDQNLALYFAENGITVPATITKEETPATCTEKGKIEYTAHVNSITDTRIVETDALGHKMSNIWSWTKTDDGYDAKVIHKCEICREGEEIVADVRSAEIDGKTVYTATAEVDGQEITDTKKIDLNYTFAVKDGTITSGAKDSYNYGDAVTVKADEMQNGKCFSGWYIGDTLITTQQSYTFYVKQNMVATAKYEGSDVAEENADVSVMINRTNIESSKQKVVFSLNWALPQGCTLKETGILRRYDNTNNLTFAGVDGTTVKRHASTLKTRNGNCNFILTVSATTKKRSINSVAYIIYTDKNGEEHTELKPVVTSIYE